MATELGKFLSWKIQNSHASEDVDRGRELSGLHRKLWLETSNASQHLENRTMPCFWYPREL